MTLKYSKILISGVGLLGGSVAKAVRKYGLAKEIVGVCRSESSRVAVQQSGAVDRAVLSFEEGLAGSPSVESDDCVGANVFGRSGDCVESFGKTPVLIVLAVPVNAAIGELFKAIRAIRSVGRSDQFFLITDVGSTKRQIVESAHSCTFPSNAIFIGSHPIAGSEKSGVSASFDFLFENKLTVLTPDGAPERAIDLLRSFWQSLGSRTFEMSSLEHDRLLARTSHLPQLLASALALLVDETEQPFCGTGFAGMTRLAGGSPDVWNDILEANRDSVLEALNAFTDILDRWKDALRREDGTERLTLLKEAKKRRNALGSGN